MTIVPSRTYVNNASGGNVSGLGAWWVDAVTSLGIVWFVVKEAREAWNGEDCCSDE